VHAHDIVVKIIHSIDTHRVGSPGQQVKRSSLATGQRFRPGFTAAAIYTQVNLN